MLLGYGFDEPGFESRKRKIYEYTKYTKYKKENFIIPKKVFTVLK